ncbi:MAG: DUF305 domain-containing protein [Acidimicrobiia bacterium]|nr:DUF305 domain-containing protein [Acidimicrobiia bacterium]
MTAATDSPETGATDGIGGDGPNPVEDAAGRSNRLIALVLVVVLIFGAGVVGWRIGRSHGDGTTPGRNSVDVGFFQDMSIHHNQAVGMAFTYLANGTDPLLRQIASEIVVYQASEIGVMGEYLGRWGQSGTETGRVMAWMGMSMPADQMTGLASKDDLSQLDAARGADLDQLFTRLMIVHHLGGIHMAEFAAKHADIAEVRRWGHSMVDGQLGEISEMNRWRVEHGFAAVKVPDSLSHS